MIPVKIKLNGGMMPQKQHDDDAAFDVFAPEDVELSYGRQLINLRFALELPKGYAATIQPRSGFSFKGVEVARILFDNEEIVVTKERIDADVIRGLIDAGYRGEVRVILKVNKVFSPSMKYVLKRGTRIAQMQIIKVPEVELIEAEELSETGRGEGGIGSTGVK